MLTVQLYKSNRFITSTKLGGTTQIGRQRLNEPTPPRLIVGDDGLSRFICAPLTDQSLPRAIATIAPLDSQSIELTNDRGQNRLRLDHGAPIPPGAKRVVPVPVELHVGSWKIVVTMRETPPESSFISLRDAPPVPGMSRRPSLEGQSFAETFLESAREGLDFERVFRSVSAALGVVEQAASSATFFDNAAEAVTQIAGMDRAAVLLRDDEQWSTKSEHSLDPEAPPRIVSNTVLDRVLADKKTVIHYPHLNEGDGKSLMDICVVIAAPILSTTNEVTGVIYADHGLAGRQVAEKSVGKLEALFVELVASAVAAGIARVETETKALRLRGQLEAFFTPRLVAKLEVDQDLLSAREKHVTVMSCDIRGFSRIAERVGTELTMRWINDVLTEFSNIVLDGFEGVVVDYVGDELMAMWGAPDDQSDHAARACDAAVEMVHKTVDMARHWNSALGEEFRIGIGINSGLASVGNIGSQRKFKYGPLGNTVNVASRVQGLTKRLGADVLITENTFRKLKKGAHHVRRLCNMRLFNIVQPVGVYQLTDGQGPEWEQLRDRYEAALRAYEKKAYLECTRVVGEILVNHAKDTPALQLLARAVAALGDDEPPDSVWQFPGK